jgi:hypothetical protein
MSAGLLGPVGNWPDFRSWGSALTVFFHVSFARGVSSRSSVLHRNAICPRNCVNQTMRVRCLSPISARLTLLLLVVGASVHAADSEQWLNHVRTNNVRPGESDYPVLNQNSKHFVRISGNLPDTVHVRFLTYYVADKGAGTLQAGTYCGYKANYAAFPAFDLNDELKIVLKNGHYEGDIIVDKYLPGRCRWHLELVGYKVINGPPVMSEGYFAEVYDAARIGDQSQAIYRGKNDIWCRKMVARAGAPAGEQCESLSIMKSLSADNPISPKVLASIPTDEYEHQPTTIWIHPETQSIEVNFHDLDNVAGRLTKP